ncbi:MAG: lamin tail domain-containing protein, partial [Anaerolineae bacterium]|nr:lamin tail domain-containing protein [Anaerolineae bacterium]
AQNSCYLPPRPDLQVSKVGLPEVRAGQPITYLITVENVGRAVAASVVITDHLPAGVSFITQTSPCTFTVAGSTLTWEVGEMGPASQLTVTFAGLVSESASGLLVNIVAATTASAETSVSNNIAAWTALAVAVYEPLAVVINEVAWAGHSGLASDEWIELYNTTPISIDLRGWTLAADDGTPTINLSGVIPPYGYYLLERDDDTTVSDVAADLIYTGALENAGEVLTLRDAAGTVIDTANQDGSGWPAGVTYRSMERRDPTAPDSAANWCTNDGVTRNGLDANGNPINGTPKAQNSCYLPPRPDLRVSKVGPMGVRAGQPITYLITVENIGRAVATGVIITDRVPAGMEAVQQSSSGPFEFAQPVPGVLVWSTAVLTETAHISITGRLPLGSVGLVTNSVIATATAELTQENNYASWATYIHPVATVYLPVVLRNHISSPSPPAYVLIEAVLYDGLQTNDVDEAVLLLNGSHQSVDLSGWKLCKMGTSGWSCANLPAIKLAPQRRLWLARNGDAFRASFGFAPDHVLSGWPLLTNSGDEVVLFDAVGTVQDALVYKNGSVGIGGWSGQAVWPYIGSSGFAEAGQILYRIPHEISGLPYMDTDTAADWAQRQDNPWVGRRVRYPGWDLEQFSRPALAAGGVVTVGIAPDNAYQVVLEHINAARRTIEAELYTLESYPLAMALVEKARQGVSVTLLLEGDPAGGISHQELWACQQLHATGSARCYFMVNSDAPRIYDRYTFLHAKFIIVDGERLLVSSQNLTHGGLPGDDKANGTGGSRGVVLVTDAQPIVARASEIFRADCDPAAHSDIVLWSVDNPLGYGPPPAGFTPDLGSDWITCTVQFTQPLRTVGDWFELITAPESALRTSDGLLGLLAKAGRGDRVYVEQLYEYPHWGDPISAPNLRLESYIAAARRGATVRILLNGGKFEIEGFSLTNNVEAAAYVNTIARNEGLDLSAHLGDPTHYGIHNKMVLVDLGARGKYVHLGSINGSETSNKVNREVALQVRSAALFDYLYRVFEYDWNDQPPFRRPLISEVLYRPATNPLSGEWVELYNPTAMPVDLSGWYLGDVGPGGEYGSGLYRFPAGAVLPPGGVIVIAQQAADVGFRPDFEFLLDMYRDDAGVPNMVPAGNWGGFGFALGNEGDEVLLLNAEGAAVDVVVYGQGTYPGVIPHPGGVNAGHSLERRPPEQDTDDCSRDFFDRYPPTPRSLP